MNKLVAILLLLSSVSSSALHNEASTCLDDWSRCTPQTAFWTGILWKSCADFCQKCQGREGGSYLAVLDKPCSGGYQCQCSGGSVPRDASPLEIATCNFGL